MKENKVISFVIPILLIISSVIALPPIRLWRGVKTPANIVHLFEWKFADIANECEQFLAPNGYEGVQVSPVNENVVFENRPWWERYQPLTYHIITRSGNETEFADMLDRCNRVGVRIYVDAVFNHMSGKIGAAVGTSGQSTEINYLNYPGVPYTSEDFHSTCILTDDTNATEVRICQLSGLPDLNQTRVSVQRKIENFLNHLIDLGVAGFRVDAAKHMWPKDLYSIYSRLNRLNTKYFKKDSRPFIYQEVTYSASVKGSEYTNLGAVTEFPYSYGVGKAFQGINQLKTATDIRSAWGLDLPSQYAIVFVDNHDNQREGHSEILTFKSPQRYIMANAFMLSYPYGIPSVMSSFNFTSYDQGPPSDATSGQITSPVFNSTTQQCINGWVCEHRWPQIKNMIQFQNVVGKAPIRFVFNNNSNQIAYCRGRKGFIAFNNDATELNETLPTCLPEGIYCDVISGELKNNKCTGNEVFVNSRGQAQIKVPSTGVLAIHAMAKNEG